MPEDAAVPPAATRARARARKGPTAALTALLAAGAAVTLLGGSEPAGALLRPLADPAAAGPAAAGVTAPAAQARPVPTAASPADAGGVAAVLTLLDRRATALLGHDRAGWLAGIDPAATRFRAVQGAVYDRLAALPVRAWHYEVTGTRALAAGAADGTASGAGSGAASPAGSGTGSGAGLGAGAFVAEVSLGYRLGPDTRDLRRVQYLTVTRRSGRWAIAADDAGPTERDLWDLGPVTVARGARALVISSTAASALGARAARELDAAAARVDAVWGRAWPRTVVALVPADLGQLGVLLGRPAGELTQLAAITVGPLERDPAGLAPPAGTADRVVLNPVAFRALSALGRRVVLTHEVTHVATRASAVVTPPTWLEEGFADYVAYRGTGLPAATIAGRTLAAAAHGSLPVQLPAAGRFDPSQGDIAASYEQAWLACTMLAGAGSGDPARLVRFYRLATAMGGLPADARTAAGGPAAGALLTDAFRAVAGTDEAGFVHRWRAGIAALAGVRP